MAQAPRQAEAQQVYFGVADQWHDLVKHPDQWTYVQQHADGFYVNFIMMNRVLRNAPGFSPSDLNQTCGLFVRHMAYLESDIRSPENGKQGGGAGGTHDGASAEQERQYLSALHAAGCGVHYTSLNYGWSKDRADNLTQSELLRNENRLDFVQVAPWVMGGDINGPSPEKRRGYNERIRQQILEADGVSTDGPLGFWLVDHDSVREANVSVVKFARQHHKKSMIMLATFGAHEQNYDAKQDILKVGQDMVRYLESHEATPDVWVVFEYATDIPAVPEQIDGKPANTTSGLAYWLIHHISDPKSFP